MRIVGLWAWVYDDDDGNEALAVLHPPDRPDVFVPMIGADRERADQWAPAAQHIANDTGRPVRLIQLVNRSASGYLAPDRHMVEHVPDAGAFTVRITMAKPPTRCYLAPDEAGLEWTFKDGILTAKIAGLAIHNVLVVE